MRPNAPAAVRKAAVAFLKWKIVGSRKKKKSGGTMADHFAGAVPAVRRSLEAEIGGRGYGIEYGPTRGTSGRSGH